MRCVRVWDQKSDILYITVCRLDRTQCVSIIYILLYVYTHVLYIYTGGVCVCVASNDREWKRNRNEYIELERHTRIHGSDWVMKRPIVYVNMQTMEERGVWERNSKLTWFYYSQLLFFYYVDTRNILVSFSCIWLDLNESMTAIEREEKTQLRNKRWDSDLYRRVQGSRTTMFSFLFFFASVQ